MKTKRIIAVLVSLMMVFTAIPIYSLPALAVGGTLSGDGTEANPYLISDALDLVSFRDSVNAGNAYDRKYIKLTCDIDISTVCGEGIGSWVPIGTETNLGGTFDGAGYLIKNLWINEPEKDNQGFFGTSYGTISNLGVSGTVRGNNNVGGICGNSGGVITDCYNECDVTGDEYVGGICGMGSTIERCYNTGNVSGLALGGICGLASQVIRNCYNTGTITAEPQGGGAGIVFLGIDSAVNCYNIGDLCGDSVAHIVSTGAFFNNYGIGSRYYSYDPNHQDVDSILTERQFDMQVCFNFDFENTWVMSEELRRPVLRSNREDGCGTESRPYLIHNVDELVELRDEVNSGKLYTSECFKLMADLDLSAVCGEGIGSWVPIGTEANNFEGSFDGNGYEISNLWIDNEAEDYQGLFGAAVLGIFKNISVSGTVKGKSSVGGIAGAFWGTLSGCRSSCTVSGTEYVGGVCGKTILASYSDCYNTGSISGVSKVGGVFGHVGSGSIKNCYNIGPVSASGGTVGSVCGGRTTATMTNCYYLDTGLTGGDGTALTKAQFAVASSFPGFDFTSVWVLNSILGRPTLRVSSEVGNGTWAKPYTVSTVAELVLFRDAVNNGNTFSGEHILLKNDIDLQSVCGADIGNWIPIGMNSINFSGTFDGGGFAIENLWINAAGEEYLGLFVCNSGTIKNLGVTGSINAGRFLGGICASNYPGTISNCYSTCAITGTDYVGGICGLNSSGAVINSYNTGAISGNDYVGGLCGWSISASIALSYNTGYVLGSNSCGGICGQNNSGTVESCYYINGSAAGAGTALSVNAIKLQSSFTGFDFTNIWQMGYFAERPLLRNAPQGIIGVGTQEDALVIKNHKDLIAFRNAVNAGDSFLGMYVKLGADIDLSPVCGEGTGSWLPIGTTVDNMFCGTFDGAGKEINNLYINSTEKYKGLFGCMDGTLSNLKVSGSVTGNENVGGVCGYSYSGVITGCSYVGSVTGQSNVGGICGIAGFSTSITRSHNASDVNGDRCVGGICGFCGSNSNEATVEDCYNTGTVTATGYEIGGLCGYHCGTLRNCLNVGTVNGPLYVGAIASNNDGTVERCYYLDTCAGEGTTFDDRSGTAKSHQDLTSAEVALFLNTNGGAATVNSYIWAQGEEYPVFAQGEERPVCRITYRGLSSTYTVDGKPAFFPEGFFLRTFYNPFTDDTLVTCDITVEVTTGFYPLDGVSVDMNNCRVFTGKEKMSALAQFMTLYDNATVTGTCYWGGFYGTGSTVEVKEKANNTPMNTYTLVVTGDMNGDGVCDALDAMACELAKGGQYTPTDASRLAADTDSDGTITASEKSALIAKSIS